MKYKDWLNMWLDNYVKLTVKARTLQRYTEIVVLYLCPMFGEYEIDELSSIKIQRFVTELLEHGNKRTGKGLSASTINSIITIVQTSLQTAYNLGLTKKSFAGKIKRPRLNEKRIECFSVDEQKKIEKVIAKSKKPYLIGIILCLYTGLRIGELLALEWKDIDYGNGTLTVEKNCYYGKGNGKTFSRMIDVPKTSSSRRIIPIPKQLLPMLKTNAQNNDSLYLIAKNGKPISIRTYQRNFERLLEKSCISHRGFHALRHTFATRAIECGMDVKTLSEVLGHKNPTITLNRYAHSLMEHKKAMMDQLGKLYKNDAY